MIQQIEDVDKRETLYRIMYDIQKASLGKTKAREIEMAFELKSLQSKIYYCIAYEQLSDAIDQMVDTSQFLQEKQVQTSEAVKKQVANAKKPLESDEEIQKKIKEKFKQELFTQSKVIMNHTLDRMQSMFKESQGRNSEFSIKP